MKSPPKNKARSSKAPYEPPYRITPDILQSVSDIAEQLGRWSASADQAQLSPRLRREHRIRSIQASLAIENNSLSIEQVTAVLAGKRVLGPARDIQEARNAFAAYERLPLWQPQQAAHLLQAHGLLMGGLVDDPGRFRKGGVGIYRGEQLLHMAPPPARVPRLIDDLLGWISRADVHPLIASCVFHYEFEFIHPFADGNGRMGRLWQTLILSRWKPVLAWLPVESVVRDRQAAYYQALAESDRASESTAFIRFMLDALLSAIEALEHSDQAGDQVSDQVLRLLKALRPGESLKAAELMQRLELKHRASFRRLYLNPAVKLGLLAMSAPESPRSPAQCYRLTGKGQQARRRTRGRA